MSIDWHEQAEILLPDGRTLDGGLSVFYHEAASEAIAARLVKEYPGSFVTVSHVNAVMGNFKRLDSKSAPEKVIYDSGKTAAK